MSMLRYVKNYSSNGNLIISIFTFLILIPKGDVFLLPLAASAGPVCGQGFRPTSLPDKTTYAKDSAPN